MVIIILELWVKINDMDVIDGKYLWVCMPNYGIIKKTFINIHWHYHHRIHMGNIRGPLHENFSIAIKIPGIFFHCNPLLFIILQQIFAHAMTAQVLFLVQNFVRLLCYNLKESTTKFLMANLLVTRAPIVKLLGRWIHEFPDKVSI